MKTQLFFGGLFIVSMMFYSCGTKKVIPSNEPVKDTTQQVPEKHVDTISTVNTDITVDGEIDDGLNIDPNASPENVVKTIIKAGKTGKYGMLSKLCNEAIDMDGDAKDICGVASSNASHQKEFNDYFGHAKIVGKARINKGIAEVDIETTAEGGSKETIRLQVKYDKWYLLGL